MIKAFKELGELELKDLSESEKKKKFLNMQTIEPNIPDDEDEDASKYREVIINLDTSKQVIEIKQGKELTKKYQEEFFGFKLLGRRGKKIYFTCNNLYYHLLTVPQMISYIEEKLDNNKYSRFLDFLSKLKASFYNTENKKSYFKIEKFDKNCKKKIKKYLKGKEISHSNLREALKEYVSKDILGSTRKNFVKNLNIFSLKINDQYITESKFKDKYIDIVYSERQGRFFDEKEKLVKNNKICNLCGKEKLVTGKIDIPTKFYVTSSPYFFENLDKNKAYKSFGICQDCYQDILVGISKVEKNFSSKLFNRLRYYVIPENIGNSDYEDAIKILEDILSNANKNYRESIEKLKKIEIRNLKVNFLFWRPDQASFIVLDTVNDVYYENIMTKLLKLDMINKDNISPKVSYNLYSLKFNDLYWLLFPNYKSHNSIDPKLYRKELLNLFDSILKSKTIDYKYLITNFNKIVRKRYLKGKGNLEDIISHPFKMNLLLKWLGEITELKGGYYMEEGNSYIEIENDDIKNFFDSHNDIYENNSYRQGLFILGVLMNQVLKEQQKQNKSANILDKLNFDGLPVRRVKTFVKDVTEILNIYDKYSFNQVLHAQMIDRLQGIEHSSLNKDEVVFYILSGLSFGRYLGHKYSKNKNEEEN